MKVSTDTFHHQFDVDTNHHSKSEYLCHFEVHVLIKYLTTLLSFVEHQEYYQEMDWWLSLSSIILQLILTHTFMGDHESRR